MSKNARSIIGLADQPMRKRAEEVIELCKPQLSSEEVYRIVDEPEYRSMLSVTDSIGGRTFTLHLTMADLGAVKLTDFDRALLNDIDNGIPSNTPIADKLLGLEVLVRRIEER